MDANARPVRVLIAEDCSDDAYLAIRALKRHGIQAEVVVAETPDDLRAAIGHVQPDIIISDNSMSAMDGAEVFRIARELAPGAPFIFLSGSVLRLAAGSAHVDGATACLDKRDLDRLGDVVAEALKRK